MKQFDAWEKKSNDGLFTPLICPSVLAANAASLGQESRDVLEAGADIIHLDVMDNHYVPNLTFGPMVCSALRDFGIVEPIDVHLMVSPVDALIDEFAHAGADMISFHPEATQHVDRSLNKIKEHGLKAGIVLNPATSLQVLDFILPIVDYVLIMSVNPGFGGQKFITQTISKIERLRQMINAAGYAQRIQVDGGISADNIAQVQHAGADMFVAGSAIYQHKPYRDTIQRFRDNLA